MRASEYRLTGRLEAGALAELFRATRDGEPVVIKLFQELSSDLAYARALAETLRALAPAQHPGIVRDVDLGVVRRRLAVVRPEVAGFPLGLALRRLSTREVILPAAVALAWAIELLDIVQRAHEVGAVHGGITPGNVLLTPAGALRLCDFGAMRALLVTPALKKAMLGSGRSGYRAPEVHLGEEPTAAADVYSVGAILYELLTLREPGRGLDARGRGGAGGRTRRDAVPPPSRIDRRLNARLDAPVMRALEVTASRRFRTAGDFGAALRHSLAESGGVPSGEELRRCVAELSAPLSASSEVPFSEPFSLDPVEGGELAGAGERTVVRDERPAFSRGRVRLQTFPEGAPGTDAPPAVAAYRPDAVRLAGDARSDLEPQRDDTDPGQAGPLENGWEAPPGQAPSKRVNERGERTVVRPPRVKVIEDFSREEPLPELTVTRSGKRRRAPPEVSLGREPTWGRLEPKREGRSAPQPRAPVPAPVPASAPPPTARAPRTDERRMLEAVRRNQRWLLAVSGLALLGALGFAAAIWKLRSERSRGVPKSVTPPPVVRVQSPSVPAQSTAASAAAPRAAKPPPQLAWDAPPPRREAGFLDVRSNVQASVSIDGARAREHTPLHRYRVRPGQRKIVVEALATGDRRELTVTVIRGSSASVEVVDLKGGPR